MRFIRSGVAAAAVIAAVMVAGTVAATAEEVTLRAVGFIPKTHPVMAEANAWVKLINRSSRASSTSTIWAAPR